jgi:hypothetical protein
MFEPVPGQVEFEVVRLETQQRRPHSVGHIVGGDHREGIDQVGRRDRHGEIQSPPQRREYHQRQMDRQRDEAHRDADAERSRDRVTVQCP